MAKSNTGVQSVLEKVAEVTSSAATALQNELKRLAEERDQMVAHYDVAAEKIRQSLRSLGQHFGISHAPTGRRRRGRSRVATHSAVRGTRAHAGATAKKGKRIRRGPEELKRDAEAVFQLIKSKGTEGAKGGEIRKRHPKVGQDIRAYVEKFSSHKLKTIGSKAAMRYVAA